MEIMPMALILSSHVSASLVGGGASQRVLNAGGVDTMLVPTVLYGRHPGWGEPGGGMVEQEMMQGILSGIVEQGMLNVTDVVLTGYFADVGQVFDAASVIDVVRKSERRNEWGRAWSDQPMVVVDPIMGDAPGGLYIQPAIAAAIKDQLVPRADLVTPNAFELGHITGRALTDLASMVRAAQSLDCPVLVSSLPRQGQIGVLYVDSQEAWLVTHERCPKAPHGTGDVLTAAFTARIVAGDEPKPALEHACAATLSVVKRAQQWNGRELPLVPAVDVLKQPLLTLEAEAVGDLVR
ncbi:PfkB family carbohydrate kinase [Maricaulis sp. CAU 1757]